MPQRREGDNDQSKTFGMRSHPLENEEFEQIAQRAAAIVMDQVALRIGQSVIKLIIYIFIAVVVAATVYVTGKEIPIK